MNGQNVRIQQQCLQINTASLRKDGRIQRGGRGRKDQRSSIGDQRSKITRPSIGRLEVVVEDVPAGGAAT